MPNKFCGKCGAEIDVATGLCPNCSDNRTEAFAEFVTKDTIEGEPKKCKSKVMTTVITIILSICLFITSFLAILIYDVRNAVKGDNVQELLENVSATDLFNSTNAANDLERFYTYLYTKHGIEITDSKLDRFVSSSTIGEFLEDKVGDFCEDFFEGDAELKLRKNELINLLDDNADVVKDVFGVYLTDSETEEIVNWILNGDNIVIVSSKTLKDSNQILYYLLIIGLSYVGMAVFVVLSIIFIFLMIKNSWSQAVCGIGIDFSIFGGATGLIAILAAWITPLWETICNGSPFGIIAGNFVAVNALVSIVLLVIGVSMLVIRGLIIRLREKRQSGNNTEV